MATVVEETRLEDRVAKMHISDPPAAHCINLRRSGKTGGNKNPTLVAKGPTPRRQQPSSTDAEIELLRMLQSMRKEHGVQALTIRNAETIRRDLELTAASAADNSSRQAGGLPEDTYYNRVARTHGAEGVKEVNRRQLQSSGFEDLLQFNIKSANKYGQTTLMVFVSMQDLEGVKYCCLFACSGDECLFPALAEAALLPSDEIFYEMLQKVPLPLDNSCVVRHPFADRRIQGWKFLSAQLHRYLGMTLEQLLHDSRQPGRLNALRRAMEEINQSL